MGTYSKSVHFIEERIEKDLLRHSTTRKNHLFIYIVYLRSPLAGHRVFPKFSNLCCPLVVCLLVSLSKTSCLCPTFLAFKKKCWLLLFSKFVLDLHRIPHVSWKPTICGFFNSPISQGCVASRNRFKLQLSISDLVSSRKFSITIFYASRSMIPISSHPGSTLLGAKFVLHLRL